MSEESPDPADATSPEPQKRPGERLAKAIARAGVGSRRDAESWIAAGRVKVNGETADGPNVNVLPGDRVEVDGKALPARERTRLWLYHKQRGYVTTTHDPEGRETVFSVLPEGLPRVMTVGRLDINTEGLLLLTNDGGLARVLELPETGWLRRYRVRAFGRTTPEALAALKDGVEIDGFAYGAIEAEIERQQADNVWLRFGLREGKNREVKRVAEHLGLAVNRLIRISFGPFQLGALAEGGVEEVRTRTLQEQLGRRLAEEAGCDFAGPATSFGEDAPRMTGGRGGARAPAERSRLADPTKRVGRRAPITRPRDMPAPEAASGEGERPSKTRRAAPIADRKGRTVKVEKISRDQADAPAKRVHRRTEGAAERFGAVGRPERPQRPARDDARSPRREARPPRGDREERPDRGSRPSSARSGRPGFGDFPERGSRTSTDRPERAGFGDRPQRGSRPSGGRADKPGFGDRPDRGPRSSAGRPGFGDRTPRGEGDGPRPPRADEGRDRREAPARARSSRDAEPRWRDDSTGRSERPASGQRPDRAGRPGGPDRPRPPRRDGSTERPGGAGDRPRGPGGSKPRGAGGERPRGPSSGGRPGGDRPRSSGKPHGAGAPRGSGKPGGSGRPGGPGKPRGPGGPRGGGGRSGGADRRR